jgi:hypothetical protein
MVTVEDCRGMSELTEEEVELIAAHEHLPDILAIGLGATLIHTEKGKAKLRHWIHDEIQAARQSGERLRVAKLKLVLQHFCECHPDARHRTDSTTDRPSPP